MDANTSTVAEDAIASSPIHKPECTAREAEYLAYLRDPWLAKKIGDVKPVKVTGVDASNFLPIADLLGDREFARRVQAYFRAKLGGMGIQAVAGLATRGIALGMLIAEALGVPHYIIASAQPGKAVREDMVQTSSYAAAYASRPGLLLDEKLLQYTRIVVADDIIESGNTIAAALSKLAPRIAAVAALADLNKGANLILGIPLIVPYLAGDFSWVTSYDQRGWAEELPMRDCLAAVQKSIVMPGMQGLWVPGPQIEVLSYTYPGGQPDLRLDWSQCQGSAIVVYISARPDQIMQELAVIQLLHQKGATHVRVVVPFFDAGTQERIGNYGSIATGESLIQMLRHALPPNGELVFVDIHAGPSIFYGDQRAVVRNVPTMRALIHAAIADIRTYDDGPVVVVFPDAGCQKRNEELLRTMGLPYVTMAGKVVHQSAVGEYNVSMSYMSPAATRALAPDRKLGPVFLVVDDLTRTGNTLVSVKKDLARIYPDARFGVALSHLAFDNVDAAFRVDSEFRTVVALDSHPAWAQVMMHMRPLTRAVILSTAMLVLKALPDGIRARNVVKPGSGNCIEVARVPRREISDNLPLAIVVGSRTEAKLEAVKLWQRVARINQVTVLGIDADSGVPPQPRNAAETARGAENRAKACEWLASLIAESCLRVRPVVVVGLESGIDLRGGPLQNEMLAVHEVTMHGQRRAIRAGLLETAASVAPEVLELVPADGKRTYGAAMSDYHGATANDWHGEVCGYKRAHCMAAALLGAPAANT